MNRIILAYSNANAALAQHIDNQLSRIGIPFEHIASDSGNLSERLVATGEPVLLLVTDNFLTDKNCMAGMLETLQRIPQNLPFLPVIANGIDENGQEIPTHIDRMVNMLHYMNHWQNRWLDFSSKYQHATEGIEKIALEPELDAIRLIANQASDVMTALRERGAVEWSQFEANDFAVFFNTFGLSDWHGQYRRLVSQIQESQALVESLHLPETPISSGILAPEPIVEEPDTINEAPQYLKESVLVPEPEVEPTDFSAVDASFVPEDKAPPTTDVVEQTIRDAFFWIERGHSDRGLELLKTAAEEYPDNERLSSAYNQAVSQTEPPAVVETALTPVPTAPATPVLSENEQNAQSYDMMGKMAVEKGDFLFAKYCWDRVLEVDQNYPEIYRKLGLMTAEHLHEYKETATHYLQRALEVSPGDEAVLKALNELKFADDQTVATISAAPEPTQPLVEAPVVVMEPQALTETPTQIEVPEETHAPAPAKPTIQPLNVLITGATSGIGRATAIAFARSGYRLILTGRRVERLVALKNELEQEYGVPVLILPFDVRDESAVESALTDLPEAFRDIDILVNNAGLAKGLSPIHEGQLDHWETMIDTNVKGLLYVSRIVSKKMVARKSGHIINVCSSAGKEAYPNGNVYCATKFAVDALTKGMRFDLHAHNIRVSQVSPGHVEETEFALTRFDGDADRAKIYNDFQPLKSSDVADVILFMATRPPHVNIQDVQLFATQQASSMVINRSGR